MKTCYKILNPPQHLSEGKTLVVLGCPRGGTSLVAGVLRILGVYMGDVRGLQHEDPFFKNFRNTTLPQKVETIRDRNERYKFWGWKLPNTIYFLSEIFHELRNPHLIVVYRDPFSIALSSAVQDGRDFSQRLLDVAINHYKKMHFVIKKTGNAPLMVCSYEAILKNKSEFISGLGCFCDLHPSSEEITHCMNFIDPVKGYQQVSGTTC